LPSHSSQTEIHDAANELSLPSHTTPSDAGPPWWIALLIPSVTDLIFVLLLISLSYSVLSPRLLGDAGTGWHIRSGEQILRTHTIPRTDSFSSTMSATPWYAWEWLYDLAVGFIHDKVGLNGVVFLTAVLIALTFTLLFRMLLKRGTSLPSALLFFLLVTMASTIHFLARPHIVSWLLTLTWLQILDSTVTARNSSDRQYMKLYWLPALMLLWVNLHGGFLMGFVLLGIFLLAAMIGRFTFKDPEQISAAGKCARFLAWISALCLVASFANPYSYKLYAHVYAYLSNGFLMNHIEEFQSPNFHGAAPKCFAVLLLAALFTLALSRRLPRLSHVLLLIFATYAGLYASRNIPIASILIAAVIAPLLSARIEDAAEARESRWRSLRLQVGSFSERMGQMESRLHWHLWPALLILVSIWICAHHGRLGSRQVMNATFDQKRFPVHAVDLIVKRQVHEPIFSLDSWGGFLIYRLYPQTKVVVDDRHDLYGEQFLKDYLKVIHVEWQWQEFLDDWNVNWVLMPANSALSSILKQTPHWRIVQDDGMAILFQRETRSGP
jgi:hypothetical protein